MQLCVQLFIDNWKLIPYLQANPYWLKTKNINSLVFIGTIIAMTNANYFFAFLGLVFLWNKRDGLLYINVLLHRVIV